MKTGRHTASILALAMAMAPVLPLASSSGTLIAEAQAAPANPCAPSNPCAPTAPSTTHKTKKTAPKTNKNTKSKTKKTNKKASKTSPANPCAPQNPCAPH